MFALSARHLLIINGSSNLETQNIKSSNNDFKHARNKYHFLVDLLVFLSLISPVNLIKLFSMI